MIDDRNMYLYICAIYIYQKQKTKNYIDQIMLNPHFMFWSMCM